MDIYQKLTIVTCVTSSLTLLIVGTALLPHLKSGIVVVRDACLWAAFVLLIFFSVWYGIRGGIAGTSQRADRSSQTMTTPVATPEPQASGDDVYYGGR